MMGGEEERTHGYFSLQTFLEFRTSRSFIFLFATLHMTSEGQQVPLEFTHAVGVWLDFSCLAMHRQRGGGT